MAERPRRRFAAMEALARRFVPIAFIRDRFAPESDAAGERSDELADFFAERRVTKAKSSMVRFHHLDEPLGECNGRSIALVAERLQPDERQTTQCPVTRESSVDRVRDATVHVPAR